MDYIQNRLQEFKQDFVNDYVDIGIAYKLSKKDAEEWAGKMFDSHCKEKSIEIIKMETKYGMNDGEINGAQDEYRELWIELHKADKNAKREMRQHCGKSDGDFLCVVCEKFVDKLYVCGGCRSGKRFCSEICQRQLWEDGHRDECEKPYICAFCDKRFIKCKCQFDD